MKVCTLASGSSGNSIFIKSDNTSVIVDAGMSGKALEAKIQAMGELCESLSAILITHEHSDHIKGVGVLAQRYDLPVYVTEKTWRALQFSLGKIHEQQVCCFRPGHVLEIDSLKIETFSTSHDAADPVGYVFYEGDTKASIITDTGCMTSEIVKKVRGSHYFILEANHDIDMLQRGSYPWPLKKRILGNRGHLSNIVAGHSLVSLVSGQTNSVTLAHLSAENNKPDLAFTTVSRILAENGLTAGENINLSVAPRYVPGLIWDSSNYR
ncbi:hypothetical protein Tfer_2194 [Thermincola ferriacetica]|uniref:Metallo-beta-lactamase domain-containing protein n=1 Tax=Thermincola ferriacetica TaxID=281456 RepID=A0A0L6W1H1_9FIRM|nr:MBL fold metallo-hydrolase [Thermincola ferriacetica]KNZ69248.1 hypothetical protein Tfer_2194 [Thermincola ferriacetica]